MEIEIKNNKWTDEYIKHCLEKKETIKIEDYFWALKNKQTGELCKGGAMILLGLSKKDIYVKDLNTNIFEIIKVKVKIKEVKKSRIGRRKR